MLINKIIFTTLATTLLFEALTQKAFAGFPETKIDTDSVSVESDLYQIDNNGNKLAARSKYVKLKMLSEPTPIFGNGNAEVFVGSNFDVLIPNPGTLQTTSKSTLSCGEYSYRDEYECKSYIDPNPTIQITLSFVLKNRLYSDFGIREDYLKENISIMGDNFIVKNRYTSFSDSLIDCDYSSSGRSMVGRLLITLEKAVAFQETGKQISDQEAFARLRNECIQDNEDYGKYSETIDISLDLKEAKQLVKSKNIQVKILNNTYSFPFQGIQDLKMFIAEAEKAVNTPYKVYAPSTNSPLAN
jgi:hypothetical protein